MSTTAMATAGVEAVTDDAPPVPHLVRHECSDADGHSSEADGCVVHVGANRNGGLPSIYEAHSSLFRLGASRRPQAGGFTGSRSWGFATRESLGDTTSTEPTRSTGRPKGGSVHTEWPLRRQSSSRCGPIRRTSDVRPAFGPSGFPNPLRHHARITELPAAVRSAGRDPGSRFHRAHAGSVRYPDPFGLRSC